ncbi:hypothetical protein GF420_14775 [candidate division GN15 bacterium]|nr:hypothetical protein [candidate division GN15 bacterium]
MPRLSSRTALILFIVLVVIAFAQAIWWVVFMAILVDEKVDIARDLGASPEMVQMIQEQETRRQIMVGLEGTFFLILLLVGAWLIYRALVKAEELKFHQENFIMAVTHELKTPLASMLVSLDSMASPRIPEDKKQTLVPRMKDDIRRLERIIENVLQAGRLDRDGQPIELQPTDLSRLVERSIDRLSGFSSPVPVTINRDIEPEVMIMADQAALTRAIEAVLENSLKYHDGQQVEVTVKLTTTDSKVMLSITDKGIGLSREDCETVFERFYRVGNELTRRSTGTGLGLYLAREVIRAHKGTIAARSEGEGKGATFEITLPSGVHE